MVLLVFLSMFTHAEVYVYKNKLQLEAPNYKTAAKMCYLKLNPVYTTDEAALDVIDTCANPIKGKIK